MIERSVGIAIELDKVSTRFGEHWIHQEVTLKIKQGETLALVGGSGCGKTTLLRVMLLLQPPESGRVKLLGRDIQQCSTEEIQALRQHCGVLFQSGALFSALTVLENISFPLQEYTTLSENLVREIALLKLALVGLPVEAAQKYPSELSGGMIKRAALARALALDPPLLFLDEPTAGLDPQSAAAFDKLLLDLKATMGFTVVMVTHDMDTLWTVPDRVAFLAEKKIWALDSVRALSRSTDPLLLAYFAGVRGHREAAEGAASG